jgi:hypothetical protein
MAMGGKSAQRERIRALCEEAFAEHKEICEKLEDLEAWLAAPREKPAERWPDGLRERIEVVLALLRPHFASEETGPLYREVPKDFPRLDGPIRRLFDDHRKMVSDWEDLIAATRDADHPLSSHVRELTLRTRTMIHAMKRHEQEENEIIQRAYWDDLAEGD